MRPGVSTICMMERAVMLLPQPLSPTTHMRLAAGDVKIDAVHRLNQAFVQEEVRLKTLYFEQGAV